MQLDIVALSQTEMRVMLSDETILAIRTLHTPEGRETSNWDEATRMMVVDHRSTPPILISIPIADIEFSAEA